MHFKSRESQFIMGYSYNGASNSNSTKNYKIKCWQWLYGDKEEPNYCDEKNKSHIMFNSLSHFQYARLTSSSHTCEKMHTTGVNIIGPELV